MSHITIKDLAARLHVNFSTVSRALHDHPGISQKKKNEILKLADELDYQPNLIAKSLQNCQTKTIGVIVPEIKHHFFYEVLDGIEDVAYKAGYSVLMCKSNEDYDREVINVRTLLSNRLAGLLVSVSQNTKDSNHFKGLLKKKIPLVFFDRVCEDLKANKVIVDDYKGAFTAVEYLVKSGYKHIAHLAGLQHLSISINRFKGYQDALSKHKITFQKEHVVFGGLDEKDGMQGLKQLLRSKTLPDAVFCINDPVALGVFRQCRKEGLKIPQDIAIVGFSDNPISSLIDPPLTTIAQRPYKLGIAAAKLLLEQIHENGSHRTKTEILETELIIRKST